ncbi:MAG: hypothetical protein OEU54_11470 [Gemmatimonadota bacterium]|nr:hypothetical protein [Gemmatimonadota bacterium]
MRSHANSRPSLLVAAVAVLTLVTMFFPSAVLAQASQMEQATAALEWRQIGPTIMGGRVADLAVVESNPSTFYVGTATGGVWKTINGGTTFEPIFDDQPTASVGDITVAPSNPNVVWVGSGEPQNRQSSPWGMGVFRSTDAGRTWAHLGLENTHHISRIQVHPRDPDVAYVAAVGHLWGANAERGVYRTTDGGATWDHVLYIDEHTGTIDLAMDPNDPMTLFAAMYQRQRTLGGFNGGGPGSGIYRTLDGGDSWTEVTEGLPEGDMGRIGLDIYRGDSNMVFAIVEGDKRVPGQGFGGGAGADSKNGVYRSMDRGETWEQISTTNNRPMYYSQIRVDPTDSERIYLGGANLYRSSDGGRNFTSDAAAGVHSDHHALWINPENSDHLILAGDGGVSISWDRSDNWRQLMNLPLAQFYEIGVDNREPYHVCGGLQDNGSWCAPSDTWSNQGIRTRDWYNIGGGDGFFTVMHPTDPVVFAESQGGNIMRVNLVTHEQLRMRPIGRPVVNDEGDEEMPSFRFNWDSPILLSAHDENTVYHGGNVLFRTTDMGQNWEAISGDLTKNIDRDELFIMGVKGSEGMMSRNDGTSTFGNLTALAESPLDASVLYAGSDDGNLHVTRDGGDTWTNVATNMPGLPDQAYITRIVSSHADAGTVWAAGDNHRNDDFGAYVYVSNDFGQNWRLITSGLPDGWSMNALAQHPRASNLLFAGNEIGIYFSIDSGDTWNELRRNLPTVPVDDIKIQARENDLVIGTHGRGVWIMDDITPLEHMSQAVLASNAHLFPMQDAVSFNAWTPQGWTPGVWVAPNPAAGARIRYWLGTELVGDEMVATEEGDEMNQPPTGSGPSANGQNVTPRRNARLDRGAANGGKAAITITNADGAVVRELDGGGTVGLHEVVWDLRIEPAYEQQGGGGGFGGGGFFFGGGAQGPRVLPGTYTITLDAGGESMSTDVEVRLDPRVEISRADLMARQEAMHSAYTLAGPVNDVSQAIGKVREQLTAVRSQIRGHEDAPETLGDAVDAIDEELDAINDDLGDARRGAGARGGIERYHSAPTADALFQIERGWDAIPGVIERVNELITDRMPALHDMVAAAGLRPDLGEPIEVPVPPRGR